MEAEPKATFDVKKHLIKIQGNRQYLPVAARLVWFRMEHPDWGIATEIAHLDTEKQHAVCRATIFDATGKLMASATKSEDVRGFQDFIEKAETGAVGRALAMCGYGTQFAPELDEVEAGRIVDTPYPSGGRSYGGGGSRPPQNGNGNGQHAPSSNGAAPAHACAECEKPLTAGQVGFSERKFGKALCPDCQKGAVAA